MGVQKSLCVNFFASEKQGKSHKWWAKKIEISTTIGERERMGLTPNPARSRDTSRPLVFDSNLKSYVAIHLIGAICAQSQASYV